ncbi:M56 family metallopeptidase, partial [Pirellulales bacterium]|nr:M56 family metallopeptidase [Pirellulales bacterium]
PGLPTPALFGVWQPTLCLPEGSQQNLGSNKLRMIALHEAMHIRRGDNYLAWLLTIVRAVHWFNPVAWFAIKQIETYRELACDDGVREFTQPQERKTYADLLLQYASCRPATSLGLLGLWFARQAKGKDLARRIKAFTDNEGIPKRLPPMAALILMLLLAMVGLTDAARTRVAPVDEQPKLPVFSVSEPSAWDVLQARQSGTEISDPEEVETREYDLTEALHNVDDVPADMTASDWLLLWAKTWAQTKRGPIITPIDGEPNRFAISMPRNRHQFFEAMLTEVCRVGHAGQVVVTTRVMSSEQVEKLIDADWLGTIKYAAPEPVSSSQWAKNLPQEDCRELSLSMEVVSFEYAPYTAFIIGDDKMSKLVRYIAANEKASITNAPKVTLFSGQSALISDESLSPFVYGVERIQGEHATALQPNITVIPEGLKMDLQALALDSDTVDLRCRLTLSSIDGVAQATLPGAEVTVQTPKATRRTVKVRCQLDRGETLLVAPIAGQRSDGKKTHYYAISAEQIFQEKEVAD